MKRLLSLLFTLCAVLCAMSAKTLVAYYSYTGNCKDIATELVSQISADVLEIQPKEKGIKYEANNYAIGTELLDAINAAPDNAASYPEIDPVNISVSDYSTIVIITPLWWSQMAAIMQSFLFQYGPQMAGKNVGLIVSSASSGISRVVEDCKRLVPEGNYLTENLWINNSNRSKMSTLIEQWVTNCGLNNKEYNMYINITIGDKTFVANIDDTPTGQAFFDLLPLTITMNELNGNEKYYYLNNSLPTDFYNPQTINTGDIMLYKNNCVVLFYKTFSTDYSYTRIGSVVDPSGLSQAVGQGNVMVSFSAAGPTALENCSEQQTVPTNKVLQDGQIYIRHNGNTFTTTGVKIR